MLRKSLLNIFIILIGFAAGIIVALFLFNRPNLLVNNPFELPENLNPDSKRVVIGFLPFWLISKAQPDYSSYITQLSYFNFTIDSDGKIQKFTAPGESDPGWHSLSTGKVDDYLRSAKDKGIELSLTIFSGEDKKINAFLESPQSSAQNLIADITPILNDYGFTDLNLDIEKVGDASMDQRARYVQFVSEVRRLLDPKVSITVDAPGIAFIKDKNLADPKALAKIVDYVVLMGYDFHNPGSYVTGPVAPQLGAGVVSEFDIQSAIQAAQTLVPTSKLILAIPLYGYSWETINASARSAVLPGSAYSISNRSVEELLSTCATCSAVFDQTDKENHIIYKDGSVNVYHQIFYPDVESTKVKLDFAKEQNLGGVALWALGYEGKTILDPLVEYRR